MMFDRHQSSPFFDPAAVDAWDAWFRLREGGELRDVSIESTWERVAEALAGSGDTTNRYFQAQARWHILLDERILATAGTARLDWPADMLVVLNLASFVLAPFAAHAHMDYSTLRDAAELSVRCLDDISLRRPDVDCAPRVSIIGVADALALLGLRYDSPDGRREAAAMAKAIAQGCLSANVRLARERGGQVRCDEALLAALTHRGMPAELIRDAARVGLRYRGLTCVCSQRRLALFANNVSDALDPLGHAGVVTSAGNMSSPSPGYVAAVARMVAASGESVLQRIAAYDAVPVVAQLELRGAVQPWIDAPIDYPLRVHSKPNADSQAAWHQFAARHALGAVQWELQSLRSDASTPLNGA